MNNFHQSNLHKHAVLTRKHTSSCRAVTGCRVHPDKGQHCHHLIYYVHPLPRGIIMGPEREAITRALTQSEPNTNMIMAMTANDYSS